MSNAIAMSENVNKYKGELEFIVKDINGQVIDTIRQPNIVKIFAKEILSHRLAPTRIWDPNASTGAGAWVTHSIDLEEFSVKYITFGASFDQDGNPLDFSDPRYYSLDSVTGGYIPNNLGVGAEYDGGMINPIPIAEPSRPLKRIERVYFESSYQPAGTPLLQEDVRAINNVVVFETTLLKDEYNGFGLVPGDFFTITEVALVAAEEIDAVGACERDPRDIFLLGSSDGDALLAHASGTATISLDPSESEVDLIKEGDQIKIVSAGSTSATTQTEGQVNPYYLVISKSLGGRDIVLDRTPVDSDGDAIIGEIGVLRDGFRIMSHRILKSPIKKSESFEILVRWRIILG
jgi:hypothetical protein